MTVKISELAFDPWREIQNYQESQQALVNKYGATNVFVGTMRDFNEDDDVLSMVLEYYPGMTEKQLEQIISVAERRWPVLDAYVVHRVGEIKPAETIVLVAVWATHRGDAFDASRHIMEALKSSAPFWKKETLVTGQTRWVEKNSDGYLHSAK